MWRRDDRGAVAVEFAIIVPVLLVIIFMIFDAGRYWFVQISLVNASSQGARSVALGSTVPQAQSIMSTAAASAQSLAKSGTLTTSATSCTLVGGERWANATVGLQFTFLTPVGWLLRLDPNSTATDAIAVSSTSDWVCPPA